MMKDPKASQRCTWVTIAALLLSHISVNLPATAQGGCKPLPKLWPVNSEGVIQVPYSMIALNTPEQEQVLKAMAAWKREVRINFFEAKNPGPGCAYLSISRFDPDEPTLCWPCWSNGVGYHGKGKDSNRVTITGCFPKDPSNSCTDEVVTEDKQVAWAYIAHELGHVLGLVHEHQRREREGLLVIKKPPSGHEFTPFAVSNFVTTTCYLQPREYDFASIMHYVFNITDSEEIARFWRPAVQPSDAQLFTTTLVGDATIKKQVGPVIAIGIPFLRGITKGDAQALQFLYTRIGPEKKLLASEATLCK